MHVGSIQVPIPYPRALTWLICTLYSISSAIHKKNTGGRSFDRSPLQVYFGQVFQAFATNHAEGFILLPWLSEDIRESTIKSQEINYTVQ